MPGRRVRPANWLDLPAYERLHREVHGFDSQRRAARGRPRGDALVVKHGETLTGYASQIGFFGHAVSHSKDDLKALIAAAPALSAAVSCCRLATPNCCSGAWRTAFVVQPMTLMSLGPRRR